MNDKTAKPKIQVETPIPSNLILFFEEVQALIEQNDESTTIPSDDLIQADIAYGGLVEEGGDNFMFEYLADEKTESTWDFELSRREIAEIASGKGKTLRLWRCQTPNCLHRFGSADDTCPDCDYS